MGKMKRFLVLSCILVFVLTTGISAKAANIVAKKNTTGTIKADLSSKPASMKSSNKKVAVLQWNANDNELIYKAKKPGKAKLTYKAGSRTYSVKIFVFKDANPFKSIKIGAKSFKSKDLKEIDDWGALYGCIPPASGKLKVKMKKGWKIQKITVVHPDGKRSVVKNKKKVSKVEGLIFLIKNTKYKFKETVTLMTDDYFDDLDDDLDDSEEEYDEEL